MKGVYILAGIHAAEKKAVKKTVYGTEGYERDYGWLYASRGFQASPGFPAILVKPGPWFTPEMLQVLQPALRFIPEGCRVYFVAVSGEPPVHRGALGRLLELLGFGWTARLRRYSSAAAGHLPRGMVEALAGGGELLGAWRDGREVDPFEFPAEKPSSWGVVAGRDYCVAVVCRA